MRVTGIGAAAVLTGAALLAAAPAASERIEREYHESFDVSPGDRLHLEHGDGDVTITPWAEDRIQIDVVYRAEVRGWGAGSQRRFEVEFRQREGTLRVIGREPSFRGAGALFSREYSYTYDIQAPPWVELRLEGDDGDVRVEGWRASISAYGEDGDLRLRDIEAERVDLRLDDGEAVIDGVRGELTVETADGDVRLLDCASTRVRLSTDDGDITVRRCTGEFEVSVSDGEVLLADIDTGRAEIRADDGDVELELTRAENLDLRIRTEDGDVSLYGPVDLAADLDIRTGDGSIRVEFPQAELSRTRRRVTGRLGAGGGRILIATDDGSVVVRPR